MVEGKQGAAERASPYRSGVGEAQAITMTPFNTTSRSTSSFYY